MAAVNYSHMYIRKSVFYKIIAVGKQRKSKEETVPLKYKQSDRGSQIHARQGISLIICFNIFLFLKVHAY